MGSLLDWYLHFILHWSCYALVCTNHFPCNTTCLLYGYLAQVNSVSEFQVIHGNWNNLNAVHLKLLNVRINHRWYNGCTTAMKRKFGKLYRLNQVANITGCATFNNWVAVTYYIGLVLIITMLFSLIRYNSQLTILVMLFNVFSAVQVYILMVFVASLALKVRSTSVRFYTDFLRNDSNSTKLEKLFWKSCLPLEYSVGGMFTVASRNFCLQVFAASVFETVMSLILTFR